MERARGAPRAWETPSSSSAVTTPSSARTSLTRERTPWHEPKTPQVGKHGGIPILYPRDDKTSAGLRPTEGSRILRRQRALGRGDGRAMGITLRMAQKLGQALRELVGDGVPQSLGLLVYVLP